MQLTLPHHKTQEVAIKKIDTYLNQLLKRKFSVTVIDPQKTWEGNIMRFSFTIQKLFFTLDFEGTVIVTDQEVIGEAEVPAIVTTFFSEDRIKEEIKKEFNRLFKVT